MDNETVLKWPDYLVITLMLLLSAAVGFYYACVGGKQKTTKEYIMADNSMHWLPVGASLVASYISTLTMIGTPAEIYAFGTIFGYVTITRPISGVLAHTVFLPVFKNLRVTRVYEYTAMRFGQKIALLSMTTGVIQLLLRTTMVVYGPSLALSQVTGIDLWLSVVLIAAVAVSYTFLGGLKAVLWADSIQFTFMVVGFAAVFIQGIVSAGGISTVWEVNQQSGRLDFLDASKTFSLDPRMRHTIWSQLCGGTLIWSGFLATSQSSVQRVLSMKSDRGSFYAYSFAIIGLTGFTLVAILLGLVIFAYYKHCDPISAGIVSSKDQLYPLFIVDLFGKYPGVSGFMLSSMFSASLSTISTTLSSISAVFLQNIIRPCKPDMTDKTATMISKVLCLIFGCVTIGLVGIARVLGRGVLSMSIALGGMTTGPNLAIFALEILNPFVNRQGMLVGFLISFCFITWKGMGGLISKPYVYKYPVSTAGCNVTDPMELANLTLPTYDPSTWNPESHYRSGVESLYDISYIWNSSFSFMLTFVIASVTSLFIGNQDEVKVGSNLITPVIIRNLHRFPQKFQDAINSSKEIENYDDMKQEDEHLEMSVKG